ncbi:MAG: hypothetical protein K8S98_15355 [Planctomycetes bacterium]|nr:hypothetical protein [Planctomycetota bacterium]
MPFALAALLLAPTCNDILGDLKNDIEDIALGDDPSGTTAFEPHTTKYAALPTSKIVVAGERFVYLANEAASGKNFNAANGDVGLSDDIAVVVNMKGRSEHALNVDANDVAILGRHVYLAVSERDDSWDWNQDGDLGDDVLLHYPGKLNSSPAAPDVGFVDTLDGSATTQILVSENRLFYTADLLEPLAAGESNLKWIDRTAPATPIRVLHNVAASAGGGCHVKIQSADEGMLFATIPELVETVDHNNDGDATDSVLALVDATDVGSEVLSTQFAVSTGTVRVRARATGAGDWLVGFLVHEGNQNDFIDGLNDAVGLGFPAGWEPTSCTGYSDTDLLDDVLFFLNYAAWFADPVADAPQNTGLAGINRVLAVPGFVGTMVLEAADGSDAPDNGCDANDDGDKNDVIFRWVSTATPLQPFNDPNQLVAFAVVNGNASGISDLDDRFLCVVDEAADKRNHDADSNVNNLLVAWLDPTLGASAVWNYDREPTQPGIQSAVTTWLSDRPKRDRVLFAMSEKSFGTTQNKSWKDKDVNDQVPTFARFSKSAPDRLTVPHGPVALFASDGGLVIAKNSVFCRVDEIADTRDWNGDGAKSSPILVRTTLSHQGLDYISPLNILTTDSVFTDEKYGAAFLVDEALANHDYNHDGDKSDFVVRWIRTNP